MLSDTVGHSVNTPTTKPQGFTNLLKKLYMNGQAAAAAKIAVDTVTASKSHTWTHLLHPLTWQAVGKQQMLRRCYRWRRYSNRLSAGPRLRPPRCPAAEPPIQNPFTPPFPCSRCWQRGLASRRAAWHSLISATPSCLRIRANFCRGGEKGVFDGWSGNARQARPARRAEASQIGTAAPSAPRHRPLLGDSSPCTGGKRRAAGTLPRVGTRPRAEIHGLPLAQSRGGFPSSPLTSNKRRRRSDSAHRL